MSSKKTKITSETNHLLSGRKSYSIDEIMAAGGTTAFASKLGKSPQIINDRLAELPTKAFLTQKEAASALDILKECK